MANIKDIGYIVNLVKIDTEREDSSKDLLFKRWAIQGLKELSKHNVIDFTKSVRLAVTNRRADLPEDYQEYLKIGICINGKVMNFTINDKICLDTEFDCCGTENIVTDVTTFGQLDVVDPYLYPYNWYYSADDRSVFDGIYGHGNVVYKGGYRIDGSKNQIVFDFDIDEILLEYRGGEDNAYIPDMCVEALVSFVHSQRCLHSRNRNEQSMYRVHRKKFENQVGIINSKLNGLTLYEIMDIVRDSWKYTIKL